MINYQSQIIHCKFDHFSITKRVICKNSPKILLFSDATPLQSPTPAKRGRAAKPAVQQQPEAQSNEHSDMPVLESMESKIPGFFLLIFKISKIQSPNLSLLRLQNALVKPDNSSKKHQFRLRQKVGIWNLILFFWNDIFQSRPPQSLLPDALAPSFKNRLKRHRQLELKLSKLMLEVGFKVFFL